MAAPARGCGEARSIRCEIEFARLQCRSGPGRLCGPSVRLPRAVCATPRLARGRWCWRGRSADPGGLTPRPGGVARQDPHVVRPRSNAAGSATAPGSCCRGAAPPTRTRAPPATSRAPSSTSRRCSGPCAEQRATPSSRRPRPPAAPCSASSDVVHARRRGERRTDAAVQDARSSAAAGAARRSRRECSVGRPRSVSRSMSGWKKRLNSTSPSAPASTRRRDVRERGEERPDLDGERDRARSLADRRDERRGSASRPASAVCAGSAATK